MELIEGRRSINYFEAGRIIPRDTMLRLISLAGLAPSSMNLQPWRAVVVESPERKAALRKCAMGQAKAEEASAVVIVVADPAALEENLTPALKSSVELGYMDEKSAEGYKGFAGNHYGRADSEKRRLFAVKNSAFFAMSLMLAARGLGLDTHPMDGFDEEALKKEFGIGADKVVPVLICVGWLKPGAKLLPRAWRMPPDSFVSFI